MCRPYVNIMYEWHVSVFTLEVYQKIIVICVKPKNTFTRGIYLENY